MERRTLLHMMALLLAAACVQALLPAPARALPYAPWPGIQVRLEQPAGLAPCTVVLEAPEGAPLPERAELAMSGTSTDWFGPLPIEAPGDYLYRVRLVPGSQDGVVWDSAAYTVRVSATEEAGRLSFETVAWADGSSGKGPVVFRNVLKPRPPAPAPGVPDTGDPAASAAGLLASGAAVAAAAWAARRKTA